MSSASTIVVLAALSVAVALPLLVWSFTARPDAVRQRALVNLHRDFVVGAHDDGPTVEGGKLVELARRFTPLGSVKLIDDLLSRAGRPATWPLERILVSKLVVTVLTGVLMFLVLGSAPSVRAVALALGATALAWALPEILLYNAGQKRRQLIQDALPDTLDQLTIAVDAGLGFESALQHTARNSAGPLPEELIRTLQDIQIGTPRRVAYLALADRTQVADLRRFVRSIVQADEHGISIARVLATQAKEMRVKRRQRAEEKAMQVPVKVIFPLILLLLPVLFIVLMGPAAINMMDAFSGM